MPQRISPAPTIIVEPSLPDTVRPPALRLLHDDTCPDTAPPTTEEARDSEAPESGIRELKSFIDLPEEKTKVGIACLAPPRAPLHFWVPGLRALERFIGELRARTVVPACLDPNTPVQYPPVPQPPRISIWRWLWLALMGG